MNDKGTKQSPLLWAGSPNVLAIARHLRGDYLVTASVMRLSNAAANLKSKGVVPAHIHLPGHIFGEKGLSFNAREQGTVGILSNSSGKPAWIQLDSWHEDTHPLFWPSAHVHEVEVYAPRALVRTEQHNPQHPLDFTNFTSYVDLDLADNPICVVSAQHGRSWRVRARAGLVNGVLAPDAWGWVEMGDEGATRLHGGKVCLLGTAEVDKIERQPRELRDLHLT